MAEQEDFDSLGTQVPNIVEYDESLFVMYYDHGVNSFVRSDDGGQSWSDAITPFPHVGLNGVTDFVVDSNGDLHFFWAQRVTYDNIGQVNGLWHSTWEDTHWSDYESVVTGRKLVDEEGFASFDPVAPSVAISGGNDVLVTWRTDYASRGNGVWYSTAVLDAPELPALPLPIAQPVLVSESAEGDLAETPEPTVEAAPERVDQLDIQNVAASSPTEGLLTSLVPVVFLILLIGVSYQLSHSRRP